VAKEDEVEPITVTVPDACRITSIGMTKIYELIGEGRLKAVKIGRRTLITTESIRRLVGEEAA
jgi:excisionase family DNA binding protein